MKFLPFLLRNVFRNRRRTLLTVTSIAVSLFLVATLLTVLSELNDPPSTPDGALRLITRHKVSLANILPIAHKDKIAKVPGVKAVVGSMWFGGVYKDPKNFFAQMPVMPEQFLAMYPEYLLPEDQKQAWFRTRTGAVRNEPAVSSRLGSCMSSSFA